MSPTRRTTAVSVLVALSLTACGAPEGSEAAPRPTPTVEPSATVETAQRPAPATPAAEPTTDAPTEAGTTATVGQVASVVAEHEGYVRELIERIGNCWLGFVGRGCADDLGVALGPETLHTRLSTFVIRLVAVEPPDEVKALTDRTVEAALVVQLRLNAFTDEGCTTVGDRDAEQWDEECLPLGVEAHRALRSLEGVLDAWRPYL